MSEFNVDEIQDELRELKLHKEKLLKKKLYKTNLWELCKLIGFNDLGECHRELCDEIQRTEKTHKRRLFLYPRSHFKTSIISIANTVRGILNDPDSRILIASSTLDNAKLVLKIIKMVFWQNEKFRAIFPEFCPPDDAREFGTQTSFTVPNRTNRSMKEGTVEAIGDGGIVVGRHYSKLVLTDIVTYDNVNTTARMQSTIQWCAYALSLLNNPLVNPVDIEGTRYNHGDAYGHFLEQAKHSKSFFPMVRPALYIKDGEEVSLFHERFSVEGLRELEKEQGSYVFCNPYETPILMSDWSVKNIGDVKIGDEVIGYIPKGSERNRCCLKKSKVVAVHKRIAMTQKMFMESGNVVRCTPDHMWYSGRQDVFHKLYFIARKGTKLQRLINITPKETDIEKIKAWSYLGGIIDGEGGCKHYGIFVAQSKPANFIIYEKIKKTFEFLNIEYSEYESIRHEDRPHMKNGDYKQNIFYLKGGRQGKFNLLNNADFAKKEQILKCLWGRGGSQFEEDRILDIKPDKFEEVYGLTTETGNYIAWGYASKNCGQYMLNPIDEGTATFKRSQIIYNTRREIPRGDHGVFKFPLYMTIDPAISESEKADHTVITIGMYDDVNTLWIVDISKGHWPVNKIKDEVWRLFQVYKPRSIGIEVIAFQKMFMNIFDDMAREKGVILPVYELHRNTQVSKAMRIVALQPRFEQHKITFCQDLDKGFIEEQILRYNVHKKVNKDDLLDTLADLEDIKIVPDSIKPDKYKLHPELRRLDWLMKSDRDDDETYEDYVQGEEGYDDFPIGI